VTKLSPSELERLGAALARAFPDAQPIRPLSVLGRGFRSFALETPGGAVFRLGLSRDAADDYAKEWRIGRFLAERLGGIVPAPRWYAPPSPDFPHGVLGYLKLPGDTPAWDVDPGVDFTGDLGAFMARLHSLRLNEARTAGVQQVDSYQRLMSARDVVLPVLADRLEPAAHARVDAWWSALTADHRMRPARLTVCHHDLWHDNLLRSIEGRLSAVLDLAHVEIGDPAHDFAAPRHFGETFWLRMVASYRTAGAPFDAEDEYRAQRYWEGREFGGLAWAIDHDDEAEIEDAIAKIARGPILF
jgi:aminoglycoside phosphotransferase (APT) family kinase protein